MNRYVNDMLPEGWARPVSNSQRTLFPQPTEEALSELRVTRNDVRKWRKQGWISFDVDARDELDEPEQNEVQFIRSMALSGITDYQIAQLVEGLPKPYSFNPRYVAFHFEYGWVVPVWDDPHDIIENNISNWVDSLVADGEVERLKQLAEQISEHIEQLTEEEEEESE